MLFGPLKMVPIQFASKKVTYIFKPLSNRGVPEVGKNQEQC